MTRKTRAWPKTEEGLGKKENKRSEIESSRGIQVGSKHCPQEQI